VVPPKLTHCLIKISLCDATGKGSQRHSFQVRSPLDVYPCSITGAPELGYLRFARSPAQLGGPFGFCAFALLSSRTARLSENRFEAYSSSSAYLVIGRYSMTERGMCQEVSFVGLYLLKREYDPNTRSIKAYSPKWSSALRTVSSCAAPRKSI
jgi:hypothetical protein